MIVRTPLIVTFIAALALMPLLCRAAASGDAGAAAPDSQVAGADAPRAEVFVGYSYARAAPTLEPGNRLVWLHGGSASFAFNFTNYLGLVADFGGFEDSQLRLTGPGANPPRVADSAGTVVNFLFGPRLSYRTHERLTPFVQGLFGVVHASEVKLSNCAGVLCTPLPSENAFALTGGGGLDLRVSRYFAIRMIQAEYLMTGFADLDTGTRQRQNDVRLSAGLVFRLGVKPPPIPLSYACAAHPASVYPGDPVTITGTALNLDPKKAAAYSWTTNGGLIAGASTTATIDTTGMAPGAYMASGHVTQGPRAGESADCSAAYTVMAFQPPTISCTSNPSSVLPGDPATITAVGVSPQNRPLTYSYSASAGTVDGTGATARLSTSGAAPGTIAIACNVADDRGQTASAQTTVTVMAAVAPAAPMTQKLCSISFDRDVKRPTRVDNEAKACLDSVALDMQRFPDARLAVVGSGRLDATGRARFDAAERAVNTKDYLVTEKGVDASRIAAYTGSSGAKSADLTLVPPGATLDTTGLTPVDDPANPWPARALRARKATPKK